MPSSSSRTSSQTLKQGTLPFGSSKRLATTQNLKTKASRTRKPSASRKVSSHNSSEDDVDVEIDDIHVPSSDDEHVEEKSIRKPEERPITSSFKVSKTGHKTVKQVKEAPVNALQPKDNVQNTLPELNEKDPRWRKHYVTVREKMGHLRPIHAEGQNKIHEILRVFDLSYEYGPCVGISRLDRWERASAVGLNPPAEVKEILTTQQGTTQSEFSASVLTNEV